jgi:hypothetical protein
MIPVESTSSPDIFGDLPSHVREHWCSKPMADKWKSAWLPPDSEQNVVLESKITPNEIRDAAKLRQLEEIIGGDFTASGLEIGDFVSDRYNQLKTLPVSYDTLRQSLALTLFSMRSAYQNEGYTDAWETQRIGLIRAVHNLADEKSPGLVINLRSGMGKSSVLAMALIPPMLLVKKHVDVLSLTPLSRLNNARHFTPLGKIMGIQSAELTESTTIIQGDFPMMAVGSINQTQSLGLNTLKNPVIHPDVTFILGDDVGHTLLRQLFDPNSNPGELTSGERGIIFDEIDRKMIEDTSPDVLSGSEIPTETLILSHWNMEKFQNWGNADQKEGQEYRQKLIQFLGAVNPMHFIEAEKMFSGLISRKAVNSLAVLRQYFSLIRSLPEADPDDKTPYFKPSGILSQAGEYDLRRRLWCLTEKIAYDSRVFTPDEWNRFFESLLPADVINAVGGALSSQKYNRYFVDGTKITVQSEFTGWPEKSREFDFLTLVAVYANESLDKPLVLPDYLHQTESLISPAVLYQVLYSKTIGLTGTATSATDWFREACGLDVTIAPPQHEDLIDSRDPYIPCPDPEAKLAAIQKFIYSVNSSQPVLVDVSSEPEQNGIFNYLKGKFPEKTIRKLSASNSDDAGIIFSQAGQPDTISVVLLMAGREVHIPIGDDAAAMGGLSIISTSPRLLESNEEQLMRRAGRAEKNSIRKGSYRCLVSPDDIIFDQIPTDKNSIRNAINAGNQPKIRQLIRKAQKSYQNQIYLNNIQISNIYQPFVKIIRHLTNLPPDKRVRMEPVWQPLLTYIMTMGDYILLPYSSSAKSPELRSDIWKAHIYQTYSDLYELTKKYSGEDLLERVYRILEKSGKSLTQTFI